MTSLTSDDYKQSVMLPPANWEIWPLTRIGAISIDILLLIVVLLLWFIPRRVYRTDHIGKDGVLSSGIVNQFKLWGFWVCGLDSITIKDNVVTIRKRRGSGCCSVKEVTYPVKAIKNFDLKKGKVLSIGLVWAFLISCLVGIWLHFIPCIWWTCDWGYFDGQGVRGAIWFATWGILFLILSVFYPVVQLEVIIQPDPDSIEKTTTYMLAVGEGCARSYDDPVATFDMETLRKCMYKVNDVYYSAEISVPKYSCDKDAYQYS